MRHRKGNKKLSKPTDQRIALLRSLVRALFIHKRIKTTDVRAKEAQRFADNLISLAKKGSIHARRLALKKLPDKKVIQLAFNEFGEKYQHRDGGFTRVVKLGYRRGDAAPESLLELVD